ncbi:MAG TPA: hypothetical protein VFF35_04100, partial [Bacteroidia bacterium]|nr:hypothetical protein [Bacteroidia bacterium]
MKKQLILLFCLLFSGIVNLRLDAQNNVWSLPGYYYQPGDLPLPLPTPTISDQDLAFLFYQGQRALYSHNAMQDAQGNLLFFIVDDKIYDRNGYLIDEMKISGIKVRGSQEICIVPVPGSCTR